MKKRNVSIYPLLMFAGFTVGWGLVEPYWLQVKREEAYVPRLPPAWQGQKIALMGDFHVGMYWANVATYKRAVRRTVRERPAAVFLTGDFLYLSEKELDNQIETGVAALRPLIEANIPTYTVFGNHDFGLEYRDMESRVEYKEALEEALKEIGVITLENDVLQLDVPTVASDEPLYLVAIGSAWAKNDKAEETIADVPLDVPRIVLMHNPDSFSSFPAHTAPFAMAGHTHGGQIRIPMTPPSLDWIRLIDEVGVKGQGWTETAYGKEGNRLYINRGIGLSSLPLRIACRPELTIFTLKQGTYPG